LEIKKLGNWLTMSDLEKYILEHRDDLDRMEAVPEEAMWQKIRANAAPQKPPVAMPPVAMPPVDMPAAKFGFNWKLLSIAALVLALAGWGLLFFSKAEPAAPAPLKTPPTQAQAPQVQAPIAKQDNAPAMEPAIAEQQTTATQKVAAASPKGNLPVAERPKAKRQPKATKAAPTPISEDERRLQQLVTQKQREIGLDTLDRVAYAELLRELDELEISVAEARQDLGGMPQRERLMETLIRYYELKIRILEQINYEINKRQYHEALEKRI
jgi:hypothetical protein